jgi:hypothetical protein
MGKTPGGRGEYGEAHQGLEGEGRAPGEEIYAGRRSSGDLHGGGAARGEKGGGVVREVQGMVLPLYRVERGRGTADMAVGCGYHGGGHYCPRWAEAAVGDWSTIYG